MTERKGRLMKWKAECGHWMVCYSLEPTPTRCPDCADKSRTALAALVESFDEVKDRLDLDGPPSTDDAPQWLDEWGVTDEQIRKDVTALACRADEIRADLFGAHSQARALLTKYPEAERLTMPDNAA
ncbi:hypothetical protein [Mycolicibacterium palauense]|uniref:hypothetical protein n=1 Tax=Mycolicibacterium palauense TaxID=2034511 RepID=UPI0011458EBF|nr:hypothetical protein [Mycolicibacterium palauense]